MLASRLNIFSTSDGWVDRDMKTIISGVSKALQGAACLALVTALGCGYVDLDQGLEKAVQGSGKKASEVRKVGPFHGLDLAGSGEVEYRIGSPQSLRIETDDNLLSHVETVVKNGTLRIGYKGNTSSRIGLKVTIVAPACDSVVVSGSGNVRVSGMKESNLTAAITGSGNLAAAGSASKVSAEVSGSGSIDLRQLKSSSADTVVTGSGNIRIGPARALNATISGSGNISYQGSPNPRSSRISGSGTVYQE
jgi:hypothetical protein